MWTLQELYDSAIIISILQSGNHGSQKLGKSYGIDYLGREWKGFDFRVAWL